MQLKGDAANRTLRVFRRLSRFPFGKLIYSKLVNFYAPYTGTIRAIVTDLIPGNQTVPVEIHDMSGDVVVKADIMLSVSRRPDRDMRVS